MALGVKKPDRTGLPNTSGERAVWFRARCASVQVRVLILTECSMSAEEIDKEIGGLTVGSLMMKQLSTFWKFGCLQINMAGEPILAFRNKL